MILFTWITEVKEGDVRNIWRAEGGIMFSIRRPSGNHDSWNYSEIMSTIESALAPIESRRNVAQYNLTMSDEERVYHEELHKTPGAYELTPEHRVAWEAEVIETSSQIEKLKKAEHLFWQSAEKFNAGEWIKPGVGINEKNTTIATALINSEEQEASPRAKKTKTEEPKSIKEFDEGVKLFIRACDTFQTPEPTRSQLLESSQISESQWGRLLSEGHFLLRLGQALEKKMHYAKKDKTREFWGMAHSMNDLRITKATKRIERNRRQYSDDVLSHDQTDRKRGGKSFRSGYDESDD